MNVCVFCSANDVDNVFKLSAAEFAKGLAESGHALIWGGSAAGMMNVLADNVSNNGGRIIGISTELLRSKARETADEMIFASSLSERKQMLLERSDCFVIMVGGIGTLDEATEMLELKKLRVHSKPIILLNQAGFYEGLEMQLRRMEESGFLPLPLDELVVFAETPQEVLTFLATMC